MTQPGSENSTTGAATPGEDPERRIDDELIRRTARGDRAAFEKLYYRHSARLGRYLWRTLRDRDLVEEAVSDTMLAVWTSAERFDFRVRLTTWMFSIAHHKGLKVLARATRGHRQGFREESDSSAIETLADPDTPDRTLSRHQAVEQVGRGLDTLSAEHRQTLELACIDGLSYAEIASITACPVNTVKTRVFHARRRLADYLARVEVSRAPMTTTRKMS